MSVDECGEQDGHGSDGRGGNGGTTAPPGSATSIGVDTGLNPFEQVIGGTDASSHRFHGNA